MADQLGPWLPFDGTWGDFCRAGLNRAGVILDVGSMTAVARFLLGDGDEHSRGSHGEPGLEYGDRIYRYRHVPYMHE